MEYTGLVVGNGHGMKPRDDALVLSQDLVSVLVQGLGTHTGHSVFDLGQVDRQAGLELHVRAEYAPVGTQVPAAFSKPKQHLLVQHRVVQVAAVHAGVRGRETVEHEGIAELEDVGALQGEEETVLEVLNSVSCVSC